MVALVTAKRGLIYGARTVLAFIALVACYWLVCIPVFVAIYLLNTVVQGNGPTISAVGALAFAGFLGVRAGVALLNRFFRPYPARTFAGLFIAGAGFMTTIVAVSIIWQLIDKQTDEPHFIANQTAQLAGGVAAIGTCWWALWRKRSDV